ncbi:hypothetical protein AMTRI_Chr13g115400 [Amborella trichopoda]
MEKGGEAMEEAPLLFRCPISMEIMKDPVTVCTGVTYEKKNIEKWLLGYKKNTCPATMQALETLDLTPNLTLKRLIQSWHSSKSLGPENSPSKATISQEEIVGLLKTINSSPFKVSALKKTRSVVEFSPENQSLLIEAGGIEVLSNILLQVLLDNPDNFLSFRACEEALSILNLLPFTDHRSIAILTKPDSVRSLAVMIQSGAAESRLHALLILRKIAKNGCDLGAIFSDHDLDILKALLEILSDGIDNHAMNASLEVLMELIIVSRKNRLKAIEAGAVCLIIELLPDSNRPRCEKMLMVLKLLCEISEGRSALADHAMGIAVISKKIVRVSDMATKLGVKILWLICSFYPTQKILDDLLHFGSVSKLCGLMQAYGNSSTKEKALKILKLHGKSWRNSACFPSQLQDYLKMNHENIPHC